MADHFLRLEEAATVHTHGFLLTQRVLEDLVADRGMGVVHGRAGLGKTFAVRTAVDKLRERLPVNWFEFPARTTTKAVVELLLTQITGIPHAGKPRIRLEPILQQELAYEPRLLVIDEAQRLWAESIEYLRHLYDQPSAQFALLFVGGDGCWKKISQYPMIKSRLYRRVRFEPLTQDEVVAHIPSFHPVYKRAPEELMIRIDQEFAHGVLRDWAKFTKTAVLLMKENTLDELSDELVDNVYTLHGTLAA